MSFWRNVANNGAALHLSLLLPLFHENVQPELTRGNVYAGRNGGKAKNETIILTGRERRKGGSGRREEDSYSTGLPTVKINSLPPDLCIAAHISGLLADHSVVA